MTIATLRTEVAESDPIAPVADIPVPNPLPKLLNGEDLPSQDSEHLFERLVLGRLEPAEIAGMLIALRMNGETAEEMIGAARALAAAARPFERPDYLFADSCGTGGDCSGSINVSTAAGLVAAACGLPVVKHGNRSFTSKCGSADVLEELGARLDCSPEQSRRQLDETGFCFLLAPAYHPGIAHAGAVRRALGVRTIMNLLGPCLNPARPPVQLLGVPSPDRLIPIAETLRAMGVRRALVVHGSGLDEVAVHAFTRAVRVDGDDIDSLEITPEQAGLKRFSLEAIAGGEPADNARLLIDILSGRGSEAQRAIVSINAGALLETAGIAADIRDGVERSEDAISSGRARRLLGDFVESTRG